MPTEELGTWATRPANWPKPLHNYPKPGPNTPHETRRFQRIKTRMNKRLSRTSNPERQKKIRARAYKKVRRVNRFNYPQNFNAAERGEQGMAPLEAPTTTL